MLKIPVKGNAETAQLRAEIGNLRAELRFKQLEIDALNALLVQHMTRHDWRIAWDEGSESHHECAKCGGVDEYINIEPVEYGCKGVRSTGWL